MNAIVTRKYPILYILFLLVNLMLFSFSVYPQGRERVNIPIDRDGEFSFWYELIRSKAPELQQKHLLECQHTYHCRIWIGGHQVLDFYSENDHLSGGIISYCEGNLEQELIKPDVPKKQYFFKYEKLDSSSLNICMNLIKQARVESLLEQDSIQEWRNVMDGIFYLFEEATPSYYWFKSYVNPSSQPVHIEAARIVTELISSLSDTLQLRPRFNNFRQKLPYGLFSYNGIQFNRLSSTRMWKRIRRAGRQRRKRVY